MRRIGSIAVAVLAVATFASQSLTLAQTKPDKYQPLSNQEMAKSGIWDQWVKTFGELTAKQKAEVMRRHLGMCLDSFELTPEQQSFVRESAAKVATEEVYGTADPEKKAEILRELQLIQAKALALLGRDLATKVFADKPPLSVLEAVKNDPSFK